MKVYEQQRAKIEKEVEPMAEAAYNAFTAYTVGFRPRTWSELSDGERDAFRRATATVLMIERYGPLSVGP